MPPPTRYGSTTADSSVGAFGYATLITTGGAGTFEDPYTGVYNLEVANFNAATYDFELPFTVPMTFRVKTLRLIYIGGGPGVILYPSVNIYLAGATAVLPLGVPQVTTLATDTVVWDDLSQWIVLREQVVNGCNVLVNQRGNITINHANYAATDDYRIAVELEWVI